MTEEMKKDLVIQLYNLHEIKVGELTHLHNFASTYDMVVFLFDDGDLPPIVLDYVFGSDLYEDDYDAVEQNYYRIYDALVEHKIISKEVDESDFL